MAPRFVSLVPTWAITKVRSGASLRPPPFLLILVEFAIVALVFALDLRDLSFKTQWIGPQDTFSFTAIGTQVLQQQPLVPVSNVTTPGASDERLSGWSSFLEKCDSLRPIGGNFFLHAMGENCRFGPASANVSVPKIMFASSLRVDSVAWAACKLLRADRRPVVCRSRMVENFPTHYNMAETPLLLSYPSRDATATTEVPVSHDVESWTSEPGSAAETEVLELLDVIGESAPLGRVICVEGFVYQGPGRYVSSIFGCGSPNRYHSAFVGVHASAMAQFHQNKAWLTSDWLYLFGVPLLIRQNCLSLFNVVVDADQTVALVHQTLMNFSSSGALYVIVIAIDVILVIVSLLSTIEIASLILVPMMATVWSRRNRDASGNASDEDLLSDDYQGVLTCPVIRSTPFAVLMLFSQLVSWLVVLANSVIWSWTEATPGKIQAYLSTLRFWIIALIACNLCWNVLVFLSERHAYAFAKKTRVAVVEILFVACTVAYVRRDQLFAIGGAKYSIEGQRQLDFASFSGGFLGFGNAYPESLNGVQVTSGKVLKIIYQPLFEIIGWCMIGASAFALARFIINYAIGYFFSKKSSAASCVQPKPGAADKVPMPAAKDQSTTPVDAAHNAEAGLVVNVPSPKKTPKQYRRLPLEDVVNLPIRARSLLRNTAQMEAAQGGDRQLRASAFVEHGVILDNGRLRTRMGFFGTVLQSTSAEGFRMPDSEHGSTVLNPLG
ncbi:hypothetical protein ATCC90586_003200 [Pythium insidiosum]|nr:hypothetical protein ATCC90586_003200 [Pythium insidiosum]